MTKAGSVQTLSASAGDEDGVRCRSTSPTSERAPEILLRRRPGRNRRAPRLRTRPGRQAAPRRALHRLRGGESPHALPDRAGAARRMGGPGSAPRSFAQLEERGIRFDELAEQPATRTPTRSTCSAISPSTLRCAPAASARSSSASRAKISSSSTDPRRGKSSTSCSRNTPSTAPRSLCCPTCSKSRRCRSTDRSATSSRFSAVRRTAARGRRPHSRRCLRCRLTKTDNVSPERSGSS